jgi:hypothetical protein
MSRFEKFQAIALALSLMASAPSFAEHGASDDEGGSGGEVPALDLSALLAAPASEAPAERVPDRELIDLSDPNLKAAYEMFQNEADRGTIAQQAVAPILQKIAPIVERMEMQAEEGGTKDPKIKVSIVSGVKVGSRNVLIEAAKPAPVTNGAQSAAPGTVVKGGVTQVTTTPASTARTQVSSGLNLVDTLMQNQKAASAERRLTGVAYGAPAGMGTSSESDSAERGESARGRIAMAQGAQGSSLGAKAMADLALDEASGDNDNDREVASEGQGFSVLHDQPRPSHRWLSGAWVRAAGLDEGGAAQMLSDWRTWVGSLVLVFGVLWTAAHFLRREDNAVRFGTPSLRKIFFK